MGIMGVSSSGARTLTYRNRDGSVAGTVTVSKPAKKKKKLQYNFKQISRQIMSAKTPEGARRVLTRAKGQTVLLRRKRATGDYDEAETRHAIIHAEKMERIAKKRMKHLREEERAKKGGPCEGELEEKNDELTVRESELEDTSEMSEEEMRQLMEELMQEMQELMEEMEDLENGDLLEELSAELSAAEYENMDPEDLELLKKKHRSEELRDIMEADMKYLKALFGKLEREKESVSQAVSQAVSNAVSLEISGAEVPIPIMEASAAEVVAMGEGNNVDVSL